MPNPKVGTVTNDVTQAVRDAKGGAVEFRVEKAGIVHAGVGKASFTEEALLQNIRAFDRCGEQGEAVRREGNLSEAHRGGLDAGSRRARRSGLALSELRSREFRPGFRPGARVSPERASARAKAAGRFACPARSCPRLQVSFGS